ncbi:cell division protein FtsK [Streptomyces sp. Je 1-4]|uniref:cell division protein FtsK n=1 Tax=Streptomyces TaxID=1883 RepID=UPI0021D9519B|nr:MULTISPECIES: cell division protein FtsK [unclassified Streptomyces]UYB41699.1 cell division protein FtsK [Streptomyces sp. Je 1-4]UZQ37957.1 cell division protein FtsK [Streptomyces sp. Je 1-4] [Streptomyces sp. Je 1-4 4N24]UZQ45374.1 cell division protein FtsK [Streptomyces sp. Je 1-4] [Streptomyces sp. Je 1-4 4N24_ara]
MNHDDDRELFNRLEADMAADAARQEGAEVVDLGKARSARGAADESPAPEPTGRPAEPDPSARVLVDGPDVKGPGYLGRLMGAKRRAIVPEWLKSTDELKTAATWVAGHYGHMTGYHALRTPVYAARLAFQAPRGAAKFLGGTMRWVSDAEGDPVRRAMVTKEDAATYLKLSRQRDGRVRLRTLVVTLATFMGLGAALALYVLAPAWLMAVSVSAVVLALGWAGDAADAPVINRAVELPKAQKLTSDIVLRALGALGIPAINQAQSKGREGFTFTAPITRDGPGWRAEGDLPYGVTVTDVIERRDKLASGLRRPLGCVWPEAVPDEHTGRLVLWVGDQDMSKAKKPAWPLAKSGTVDLFKPVPFGTDQRGRWINVTLMYIAGIIGAIPRMGKTFLLRLLLLIAALDPRAELHTYDMKGTGDLDPVGNAVSHRHAAGDDDEAIEYAIRDFRELRTELRRRTKMIRSLPRDICPESKVTSELASKKELGLHPIVIGVDECQVLFEHPKYKDEFEEIATDLVKRGPATGIVLLLATQRPDAKALPTGISANASARWCLKVMGQLENDMVLGTSAYKRGVRATMFSWGDKGIHYFVGEGADARIVGSVYVDGVGADAIALRARKAREDAGLLSGHALGEEPEADASAAYDLLRDLLGVIPAEEAKVWNETVVARLAELRPDVYGEWAAEQLTAALKPHGIETVQIGRRINGKVVNRRGIERAHLAAAVAERDGNRDAG